MRQHSKLFIGKVILGWKAWARLFPKETITSVEHWKANKNRVIFEQKPRIREPWGSTQLCHSCACG